MRVYITSVFVDDQGKALKFYTDVLGFVKGNQVLWEATGAEALRLHLLL